MVEVLEARSQVGARGARSVLALCGSIAPFVILALAPAAQAASLAFQAQVLGDAPLLYFQFNEPSGDSINHGSLGATFDGLYQGTITRGVTTLSGDTGVSFDSDADYIVTSATAPVSVTGNPTFTAETLIYVPIGGTASLWAPFLYWGLADIGESVYFGFSGNDPDEVFVGFYAGGLQSPGAGSSVIPLGSWHHIVWVRQGGGTDQQGTQLFVDGVDVTSLLTPDTALCCNGTTPTVMSTAFRINVTGDLSRFFVGSMDELALYDRALSATEVQDHYAALNSTYVPALGPGALMGLAAALTSVGGGVLVQRRARRKSAA